MSRSSLDLPVKDQPQLKLFKAVSRANAAIRDSHRKAMKVIGLGLGEFDLLCALGNTEGMRMKDLARSMISTPSNVTRVCTTMEKKGLAVRERSKESDREVIAKLTVEGQQRFDELFPKIAEFTTAIIEELMPKADQIAVAEALDRLDEALRSRKI